MKHLIVVLLCLLLCGCGRETVPTQPEALPEETVLSVTAGLYNPDHPLEQQHPGLVRAYPLTLRKVQGIVPLGKDILVLSGQGNTRLTRFTGENLLEVAKAVKLPKITAPIQEGAAVFSSLPPVTTATYSWGKHSVRIFSTTRLVAGE